jgi:hypothetical protein
MYGIGLLGEEQFFSEEGARSKITNPFYQGQSNYENEKRGVPAVVTKTIVGTRKMTNKCVK